MSAPLRKGWCPGALRPMMAKDGLLVRLRITGGILCADIAEALADFASTYGNGRLDLSARGNLQLRGITEDDLSQLQGRLADIGMIDADTGAEGVRNVIASPLAGLTGAYDIRPVVRDLEDRLTEDTSLHRLPPKFGFLVDDGSEPTLAGVPADVRFDHCPEKDRFAIGLGGSHRDALIVGSCRADDIVAQAAWIATALIDRRLPPDAARLRHWIAADGPMAVARACGGDVATKTSRRQAATAHDVVGLRTFAGEPVLGLGAPFGRLDAGMLQQAAALAAPTAGREIRLTPWRALLIPGATDTSLDGFIVDPADPRLAVAACPGADGCERGTTSTQRDAEQIAETLGSTPDGEILVHVSGCEKGCAKPSATRLTLVARNGRYDIVENGRASTTPNRQNLDLAGAIALVATLRRPA